MTWAHQDCQHMQGRWMKAERDTSEDNEMGRNIDIGSQVNHVNVTGID